MLGASVPEEIVLATSEITPPAKLYLRMMRNLENIYAQSGDSQRFNGIQMQMRELLQLMEGASMPGQRGYPNTRN